MLLAHYNDSIITLPSQPTKVKIKQNDKAITNIIAMSQDTELNMTSQNIKYFLYANLAIMIAIASIRLMRN